MQIPKRNPESGILYLEPGDLGLNRPFELYVLLDFVEFRSAQTSLGEIRKRMSANEISEIQFLTLDHVNNCKRRIYSKIKKFKGNDRYISFFEYCQKNNFDPGKNKAIISELMRLYLRDVLDLRHPILIKS